jgi:hypothetical protein
LDGYARSDQEDVEGVGYGHAAASLSAMHRAGVSRGKAASWNGRPAVRIEVRGIGLNGNQQRVCHAIQLTSKERASTMLDAERMNQRRQP